MVAMAKKQREEADVDMGDDDVLEMWLSMEEEEEEKSPTTAGDQLTELLDATATALALGEEESCPAGAGKVRFIEDPYTSPSIFQTTPSSYVTINGNEESCGSSFSDWDSSVMASVDTSGAIFGFGSLSGSDNMGVSLEQTELDLELEQWLSGKFEAERDGAWGSGEEGLEWENDDSLAIFFADIFSEQSLA